jgi:hypothetical protein
MDAFVSRKKRKLSPEISTPPPHIPTASTPDLEPEDDSTDFKLAVFSSLHPFIEQQVLLDILLAHEGSVERASASLSVPEISPRKTSTVGYQSSLSTFVSPNDSNPSKKVKLLSRKGTTLHLYTPEDVAAHTPCSIIHNFLPAEEANALLEELLGEAASFERMSFKLFDNVVQSPHTACFYVENYLEQEKQRTEYIYNGGRLTVSLPGNSLPKYLISLGRPTINATNAQSLAQSPRSCKCRNPKTHQDALPRWQETQIPINAALEAQRRIRELLLWRCRKCRLP